MPQLNRRRFLSASLMAGAGAMAGRPTTSSGQGVKAAPPSEKVRIAVVGIRGRGALLAMGFALRKDCEVAYLCDPDSRLFGATAPEGYMRFTPPELAELPRVKGIEKAQGRRPEVVDDFRKALDDKNVDAIVTATPDHWHALVTVWSCQAGKDVYVEKPASQTPWEGRQMVRAADRYGRVVQMGTQSRSAPYMIECKKYVDSGKLGTIHLCRVYNQKHWGNVPPCEPSDTPAGLNWDLWNGPAPETPYNYNYWEHWNHFWRYSGGDSVNDSIHQLDLARWLCGVSLPKSVYCTGGRWAEEGVFETPDTQVATYQFDRLLMTFEQTLYTPYMIKADQALRDGDMFPHWPQNTTRIEIFGSKAMMVVGRHGSGWQVFDRPKSRQPVVIDQMYGRFPDEDHRTDFVDAVKTRRRPNATIHEGHLSTLLGQYANISCRLGGESLQVDPATETFSNSPRGNALLRREYRKPYVLEEVAS